MCVVCAAMLRARHGEGAANRRSGAEEKSKRGRRLQAAVAAAHPPRTGSRPPSSDNKMWRGRRATDPNDQDLGFSDDDENLSDTDIPATGPQQSGGFTLGAGPPVDDDLSGSRTPLARRSPRCDATPIRRCSRLRRMPRSRLPPRLRSHLPEPRHSSPEARRRQQASRHPPSRPPPRPPAM